MDAFPDEDEDLFDPDLGNVPANTFHQLERDAITQSQHQPIRPDPRQDFSADAGPLDSEHDAGQAPAPASSDYGYDDDDDVINLDAPNVSFAADAPPNRLGAQNSHAWDAQVLTTNKATIPVRAQNLSASGADSLQRQLAEAERERHRLASALEEIKSDNLTKAGAISNLRSRIDRVAKEYEVKLAANAKTHAEEVARLKAEIKAARDEHQNIKTNNRFLQHNLAEERDRSKRLRSATTNGTGANAAASKSNGTTTPRKGQSFDLRDGFDDDEMTRPSPTKAKDKRGTPKAGNKRKRDAAVSPSVPHPPTPPQIVSPSSANHSDFELQTLMLTKLDIRDESMRTFQSVLRHQSETGRTLEQLHLYTIPGQDQTVASMLLDSLSRLTPTDNLPTSVAVRGIILDLWDACLAVKYWSALPLLLDLFESMLQHEVSSRRIMLFERFIVLAAKTSVIVAEPRVVRAGQRSRATTAEESQGDEVKHIDDLRIMSILSTVAFSASFKPDTAHAFWQRMEFAFSMLMLNEGQPLTHLLCMLRMISSSVLEDSFGPVNGVSGQAQQEDALIDRLTSHLHDSRSLTDDALTLRLEVSCTLQAISESPHGSAAIARNRSAIGRSFRFLCDQISALYLTPPVILPRPGDDASKMTPHAKLIRSINIITTMVHHVIRDNDFNLLDKLSAVHAGHHRFKIALSRLAFCDRSLFEAGIEDVAADAAHDMLDAFVTPEEGDAIQQAMITPQASNEEANHSA